MPKPLGRNRSPTHWSLLPIFNCDGVRWDAAKPPLTVSAPELSEPFLWDWSFFVIATITESTLLGLQDGCALGSWCRVEGWLQVPARGRAPTLRLA